MLAFLCVLFLRRNKLSDNNNKVSKQAINNMSNEENHNVGSDVQGGSCAVTSERRKRSVLQCDLLPCRLASRAPLTATQLRLVTEGHVTSPITKMMNGSRSNRRASNTNNRHSGTLSTLHAQREAFRRGEKTDFYSGTGISKKP